MASVHKKGGSGGQTNFEIRLRIMFSYKDFISVMKPVIFMDVEVRIMFSYKDFISAMKSAKI